MDRSTALVKYMPWIDPPMVMMNWYISQATYLLRVTIFVKTFTFIPVQCIKAQQNSWQHQISSLLLFISSQAQTGQQQVNKLIIIHWVHCIQVLICGFNCVSNWSTHFKLLQSNSFFYNMKQIKQTSINKLGCCGIKFPTILARFWQFIEHWGIDLTHL